MKLKEPKLIGHFYVYNLKNNQHVVYAIKSQYYDYFLKFLKLKKNTVPSILEIIKKSKGYLELNFELNVFNKTNSEEPKLQSIKSYAKNDARTTIRNPRMPRGVLRRESDKKRKRNPIGRILTSKSENIHIDNIFHPDKISITLPTYNGYPLIKRMIQNVLSQSYQNWELIIVNDGSTDGRLNNYLKTLTNSKIKVITLSKNKGLPHALNVGINRSTGKYWTWISDDNEIDKTFLHKLKESISRNNHFAYCDYVLIDQLGNKPERALNLNYRTVDDILYKWVGMPGYLWRRAVLPNIGKFDENIQGCEDYDFVIRTFIVCQGKISHVKEPLFRYYKRKGTLTTRLQSKIPTMTRNVRLKYEGGDTLQKFHKFLQKVSKVIIYISTIDYHVLYQRPQQIMKIMAKTHCCIFVTRSKQVSFERDGRLWLVNKKLFDGYLEIFGIP